MEARAERMGTVATTADILEAQQKEQKVSKLNTVTDRKYAKFFKESFTYSLCHNRSLRNSYTKPEIVA